MLEQRPVSGSVRQLLDSLLRTDADLDAFCLDCFPTVYRRFAKGMERTDTVNLLLSLEDSSVVATKLRAWGLKRRTGTSGQSWRWLVVALALLGGLTAGALFVAVSRLGSDVKPLPAATPPAGATPPASIPRRVEGEAPSAAPAPPASGTNSGNAMVDSPEAQMKNRATGAVQRPPRPSEQPKRGRAATSSAEELSPTGESGACVLLQLPATPPRVSTPSCPPVAHATYQSRRIRWKTLSLIRNGGVRLAAGTRSHRRSYLPLSFARQ